jgi:hypothetical protein
MKHIREFDANLPQGRYADISYPRLSKRRKKLLQIDLGEFFPMCVPLRFELVVEN